MKRFKTFGPIVVTAFPRSHNPSYVPWVVLENLSIKFVQSKSHRKLIWAQAKRLAHRQLFRVGRHYGIFSLHQVMEFHETKRKSEHEDEDGENGAYPRLHRGLTANAEGGNRLFEDIKLF